MASRTGDLDRLSGVELPLILQNKLKSQQQASGEEIKKDRTTENELDDEHADTVFTAEELEERVLKARAAISDIQKQLLIGEESYHEETNAHGNLFRGGWELFIDVKDAAPSGHKRMPADYRWFSSSCLSTAERNQGRSMSMKSISSLPPAKKAASVARSASQASNPSAASSASQGGSGNAASDGIKGNIEAASITQAASAAQAMIRASKASSSSTTRSSQVAGGTNSSAQGASSNQGNENTTKADPMPAPAAVPPPKEVSVGRKARKRKSSE